MFVPKVKDETSASVCTLHKWYLKFGKRVFDLVVSSALILLLAVPILLLGLLIVIDSPGNPFFLQSRVGKNGRIFRIWKLRTMVSSAAQPLTFLVDDSGGMSHKVKSDPRITRVGRFLRRSSVDELPQLLNVLAGQMSLVGPRPELPEIVARYEPWQHKRHQVLPGITGWWQVSGRSSLPMHENTELDIYYVEGQSLELDIKIIRKTFSAVIKGIGAF